MSWLGFQHGLGELLPSSAVSCALQAALPPPLAAGALSTMSLALVSYWPSTGTGHAGLVCLFSSTCATCQVSWKRLGWLAVTCSSHGLRSLH